jgi:hypothetical protein
MKNSRINLGNDCDIRMFKTKSCLLFCIGANLMSYPRRTQIEGVENAEQNA